MILSGDGEFALRFPSVWFGMLAVALTGRLARRLGFRRGPTLLAAGLLAISPYTIWHSQDARMYSMSLALTTAAVWLGVETLQRQRAKWGLAYAAVAWLALHTHYYAAFVLVALNLFVLTRAIFVPRTRANFPTWILWQMVVGALYLPWLAGAATIVGGYAGNGDSPDFWMMLQRSLSVFAVGESTPFDQRTVWAVIAAALLGIGSVRLLWGSAADRRNLWLLICYLAVPVLATWWSAQNRPIFNERYLVASAPPFYLLIAAAFDGRRFDGWKELGLRWLSLGLLAVLIAGMMLSLYRHYHDPVYSKTRGWRDLAAAFAQLSAGLPPDQMRIAQNFPDPTLWFYYRDPVDHVVLPPAPHDEAGAQAQIDMLAEADVRRVLLPVQPAPNWDDRDIAGAALANGPYDRVFEQQIGVWPLRVYAGQPSLNMENSLDGEFENGMRLDGVSNIPSSPLPPGASLAPTLFAAVPGLENYETLKVTVQLLDGTGRLVAQQDLPLTAWRTGNGVARIRTYGVTLPPELAPGEYRLIAGLYDGAVEGAPRVRTITGDDAIELAVIRVEDATEKFGE
ncbi:MAG: glycosyltransferase family 39 protein [Caldilinea sp.]